LDVRTLVDLARRGQEELKEFLIDVPGLNVSNPNQLADLVNFYLTKDISLTLPVPSDRNALKKISAEFHTKAGTFTDDVANNLQLFVRDAATLRIAHQPNTFAYLGVYVQFIFLDLAARYLSSRHGIFPCQIYLIVDYDMAEDKRFRISHFPDIERRDGSLILSSLVPSRSLNRINLAVEKPSKQRIEEWMLSLRTLLRRDLSILRGMGIVERMSGQIRNRLEMIEQEIWEAYNRSSNLAEFNAIFLSRIVNLHWKMPVAFISSMAAVPTMRVCYEYLLQLYPDMVNILNKILSVLQANGIFISSNLKLKPDDFPFWYLCQKCFVRTSLKIISRDRLLVSGVCIRCGSKYNYDLGTFSCPNLALIYDKVIPKIIFDNLVDIVGWRCSGGVGYIGSAEHVLVSGQLASRLGWHALPECLWSPKGIHYGLAEVRTAVILAQKGDKGLNFKVERAMQNALFGKATILYYIFSQGFDGLLQMWQRHFQEGRHVYDLNKGRQDLIMPNNLGLLLDNLMYRYNGEAR